MLLPLHNSKASSSRHTCGPSFWTWGRHRVHVHLHAPPPRGTPSMSNPANQQPIPVGDPPTEGGVQQAQRPQAHRVQASPDATYGASHRARREERRRRPEDKTPGKKGQADNHRNLQQPEETFLTHVGNTAIPGSMQIQQGYVIVKHSTPVLHPSLSSHQPGFQDPMKRASFSSCRPSPGP